MKKLILIALLFIGFNSYAQFDKGGVIALSNKAVFALDTSARNIIHIIEDERVAGGGAVFSDNEKKYVNYIVTNFKNTGVWYKRKAIYGFVGGTAASDKWNWKDMRDLDAAFRLTFINSPTHDANGVLFNGTNQYANTFLNPTNDLANAKNDISISFYKNGGTGLGGSAPVSMGVQGNLNYDLDNYETILGARNTVQFFLPAGDGKSSAVSFLSNPNGFIAGISKSGLVKLFINNTLVGTGNIIASGSAANGQIFIGNTSINNNTPSPIGYQNIRMGFASIGDGLTDTQAIQTSNIVTFAQSILGRQ
jgi:hypothetical protein